jgi:hypothetical protein
MLQTANQPMQRERVFTVRLSPAESERLDRLAEHYGLTAAGLLRFLLKRESDAVLPPLPPSHTKPTRRTK